MLENVYYINLENRTDRKELVEKELNDMNWKYERFPAIETKQGIVGCGMSHLKLVQFAKEKNLEYIVIVEDDIQFTNKPLFNKMLKHFLESNIEYDVLLLAGNLRNPCYRVNEYLLRVGKSFTTTGYIIKRHYYDKLIHNLKEGLSKLINTPHNYKQHNGNQCLCERRFYTLDAYWMRLQEKDRWFIFYPRTVTQRPNYSDIEERNTDYNCLMLDSV